MTTCATTHTYRRSGVYVWAVKAHVHQEPKRQQLSEYDSLILILADDTRMNMLESLYDQGE